MYQLYGQLDGRHNHDYTPELLLECLPETSLLFPHGSHWSYSNLGFVLLGHALARAGSESYEVLLERHVLEPLGMVDTSFRVPKAKRHRIVQLCSYSATPDSSGRLYTPASAAALQLIEIHD